MGSERVCIFALFLICTRLHNTEVFATSAQVEDNYLDVMNNEIDATTDTAEREISDSKRALEDAQRLSEERIDELIQKEKIKNVKEIERISDVAQKALEEQRTLAELNFTEALGSRGESDGERELESKLTALGDTFKEKIDKLRETTATLEDITKLGEKAKAEITKRAQGTTNESQNLEKLTKVVVEAIKKIGTYAAAPAANAGGKKDDKESKPNSNKPAASPGGKKDDKESKPSGPAQGGLAEHNKYRKIHDAKPLTLNPKLIADAQSWAKNLASMGRMQHMDGKLRKKGYKTTVGENLAYGCGTGKIDIKEAIRMWWVEVCDTNYNFAAKDGNMGALHFTQVVWKETTELGIAIAKGRQQGMDCTYVVGRYLMMGNMMGDFAKNVGKGSFNKGSMCKRESRGFRRNDISLSGVGITEINENPIDFAQISEDLEKIRNEAKLKFKDSRGNSSNSTGASSSNSTGANSTEETRTSTQSEVDILLAPLRDEVANRKNRMGNVVDQAELDLQAEGEAATRKYTIDVADVVKDSKTELMELAGSLQSSPLRASNRKFTWNDLAKRITNAVITLANAAKNKMAGGKKPGADSKSEGKETAPKTTPPPGATSGPPGAKSEASGPAQGGLVEHNKYRKIHDAKPFKLNPKLIADAQKWANNLARMGRMQHMNGKLRRKGYKTSVGENLAYGCGTGKIDIKEAIRMWWVEVCDTRYNFASKRGNMGALHFTQVVWKETTELGIAIAKGRQQGMDCTYVVGRYLKMGNMIPDFAKNVGKGTFNRGSMCKRDAPITEVDEKTIDTGSLSGVDPEERLEILQQFNDTDTSSGEDPEQQEEMIQKSRDEPAAGVARSFQLSSAKYNKSSSPLEEENKDRSFLPKSPSQPLIKFN